MLVKAFRLLEALAETAEAAPLGDLAERTGLAKATAHRILTELAAIGYVRRVAPGRYAFADKLRDLTLNRVWKDLVKLARPSLEAVHARTQETVNLGVLRDDRVAYLLTLESPHPLRRVVDPDALDPFYSTALGKAIVAHLPASQRASLLRRGPFTPRTPRTITDPQALEELLSQVHAQGFAIERDENDLGMMCVAAPLRHHKGAGAAVSLSVPSARVDAARERELKQIVMETAAAVDLTLRETEHSPDDHALRQDHA